MDSTVVQNPTAAAHTVPQAEDTALLLPFDHPRTPSTGNSPAVLAFDLQLPAIDGVAADTLLAACLGIALARYGAQASIPLAVSRLLPSGQALSHAALRLTTRAPTTLGQALAQCAMQLGGVVDSPSAAWAAGAGRAALTLIDTELGPSPDVLGVLSQAPSELRSADLQLVATGSGALRQCAYVYNAKLFKAATMARFAGHLKVLLDGMAERLEMPIARLPLLTTDEQGWLEQQAAGKNRNLPQHYLHESFEARCGETPDAVALQYRDQRLSYAQLNRRANQLAHQLIAGAIGQEDIVVVCLEPGIDIAVALLAIWKAGAVYAPLDPAYPAARIGAILDDTRPRLLLTRSHLIHKLSLNTRDCFALDEHDAALDAQATHNPAIVVEATQTASIYYTSGTTGKPKGVMASQANLRAYIDLAAKQYGFNARDVMPAIARFSFSISMFELMSPLVAGGTLVVLDRDHVLNLDRLSRTLSEVTFFHAGPSLLKNVLAHIRQGHTDFAAFDGVRHASSGGDMIAPEVLESLKQVFRKAEVFVIYGCSEISCMGCTYPVPRHTTVTRTFVGRPFDNMVVRLFDAEFEPVPVGIVGEIHFAGAGVVKGYLNRPELTAQKFVKISGRRFYRTGDMGRLSEDGWLEILGRNDFQINVRGMRIEIGEVEYNLRKAPGVRDGVVMAKAAASGEKLLVAYVVADTSSAAKSPHERIAAVRRHMVEHLPDYMVPASYVELDALPLNHNMKVDRRALPEPVFAQQRVLGTGNIRPPETATQRQLALLWKEILKLEEVGLDDNLFELGGQSLSAVQFIARVRKDLNAELEDMEVLRESLEVLAGLCDRRLGRTVEQMLQRAPARRTAGLVETFHFGHEAALYGALHTPHRASSERAALICAPIGHEHVRTHFVLNQLARRLVEAGMPVLRFDYFGCADSLGESQDASLGRWCRDIADARLELAHRTGARSIVAVGVRLGASLLFETRDHLEFSGLVLWDPVLQGASLRTELARMHQGYLRNTLHMRLLRAVKAPRKAPSSGVELLGTTFSDQALRELTSLNMGAATGCTTASSRLLVSSPRQARAGELLAWARSQPACKAETVDFDCAWAALANVHEVIPDVGISRTLAQMVLEA